MSITDEQFASAYLERIGYDGDLTPTADNLRALQQAHVYHVPFENLDLVRRLPPNLDRDYLFDKVVKRRRGGVCYELNRSFYNLLRALGFQVECITGQVRLGGVMNEHALSLVHLKDGDYLVDVGYGDSVLPPLKVGSRERVRAYGCSYYLTCQGPELIHLMRQREGGLPARMYTVTLVPREVGDYIGQFRWSATPGNSPFSQYPICSLQSPNGRVTLRRGVLTVRLDGETAVYPADTEPQLSEYLKKYFHIFEW